MSNHDVRRNILIYLKNTFKIRDFSEEAKLQGFIEGYDREKDEFMITPWDVEQIALNTGAGDSKTVLNVVSDYADFFRVEEISGNMKVVKASVDEFPDKTLEDDAESGKLESLTVADSFKWYLYYKIRLLSEEGNRPVKISDGVFSIKNELFLPDDFVPKVMMEMVEGSKVVDVKETVKGLQPSGQSNAIFVLGKHDSGRFLEPHLFYYNGGVKGRVPENQERLGAKIASSFAEFQKTTEYENFLLSRVMRNVIFTVGTKKKRELGKPLFDIGKLKLLEKKGIVNLEGNTGVVPDSLQIDQLNQIKSEAEKSAEKVSDLWMSDSILP